MEEIVVPDILDVLYNLGDYAIFLWLYITERRAHEQTQDQLDQYLLEEIEDLRNTP